jgi:hypothetical protein
MITPFIHCIALHDQLLYRELRPPVRDPLNTNPRSVPSIPQMGDFSMPRTGGTVKTAKRKRLTRRTGAT